MLRKILTGFLLALMLSAGSAKLLAANVPGTNITIVDQNLVDLPEDSWLWSLPGTWDFKWIGGAMAYQNDTARLLLPYDECNRETIMFHYFGGYPDSLVGGTLEFDLSSFVSELEVATPHLAAMISSLESIEARIQYAQEVQSTMNAGIGALVKDADTGELLEVLLPPQYQGRSYWLGTNPYGINPDEVVIYVEKTPYEKLNDALAGDLSEVAAELFVRNLNFINSQNGRVPIPLH